jgi:hypothetical protein
MLCRLSRLQSACALVVALRCCFFTVSLCCRSATEVGRSQYLFAHCVKQISKTLRSFLAEQQRNGRYFDVELKSAAALGKRCVPA